MCLCEYSVESVLQYLSMSVWLAYEVSHNNMQPQWLDCVSEVGNKSRPPDG